jgi:hypothetical protein
MPDLGDEETRAAYTIQGAFRSLLARRRNVTDDYRQGNEAHKWFMRYKETLQPDMVLLAPGSSVRYSIVYLGPLPDFLAALDAICHLLGKKKQSLKKRLTRISGNEQGEVNAVLTKIKYVETFQTPLYTIDVYCHSKATQALKGAQRQIEPGSQLHSERNISRMTNKVKEMFDIIKNIQVLIQIPEDLQGRLDIVYKAFLQERNLPKNTLQPRPGRHPPLVMEDNYDLIQEAHKDL